ncbi:MAG: hypothetical protein JO008_05015 [Alphaproteobacteria bacterium]|nr:hypothetical protein [Alphaproteobacteria bacterium]
MQSDHSGWPPLPYAEWQDSCATLHMCTQIVGKIRLALASPVNHWWHVPLYVTSRGLTTSPMPYRGMTFQIDFDFIEHLLRIDICDGRRDSMALTPRPVADFYAELMGRLRALGIEVDVWPVPVEIADPIRFDADRVHAAYDPERVNRFWRALAEIDQVFAAFRAGFIGKVSPVHFFWGSFDLAVTRFSGHRAPPPPSNPNIPDAVNREAYSHEVSSCGFWPGNGGFGEPAFYSYAYPQPAGFADAPVRPAAAYYSQNIGEFILPYEAVRQSADPRATLLEFLQSTYEAAANLAKWDRAALER